MPVDDMAVRTVVDGEAAWVLPKDQAVVTVVCGPIDHAYVQGHSPYENVLYCQKCGNSKYLRPFEED